MSSLRLPSALLLLIVTVASGCHTLDGGYTYEAGAFSDEGRLGSGTSPGTTVALAIDSNAEPLDFQEKYDYHAGNVMVRLASDTSDSPAWSVDFAPRAVTPLRSDSRTRYHLTKPGSWVAFALIDLPGRNQIAGTFPPTYPINNAQLTLYRGSVSPTNKIRSTVFRVLGEGGTPNKLNDWIPAAAQFENMLEVERMIRLRPKRGTQFFQQPASGACDPGNPNFAACPKIGAIEFDIDYRTTCADTLRAVPNSDAGNAMAMVRNINSATPMRKAHVILIDPNGLQLVFGQNIEWPVQIYFYDTTVAGDGPILDLLFLDDAPTACGTFDANAFEISNLLVSDANGNPLYRGDDAGTDPNVGASHDFFAYTIVSPPNPLPWTGEVY